MSLDHNHIKKTFLSWTPSYCFTKWPHRGNLEDPSSHSVSRFPKPPRTRSRCLHPLPFVLPPQSNWNLFPLRRASRTLGRAHITSAFFRRLWLSRLLYYLDFQNYSWRISSLLIVSLNLLSSLFMHSFCNMYYYFWRFTRSQLFILRVYSPKPQRDPGH